MYSIYKYNLDLTERQTLNLPKGRKFLDVQVQNGKIVIWLLVDPNAELIGQQFRIIGTGQRLNSIPTGQYLGTVQLDSFVWHLFED